MSFDDYVINLVPNTINIVGNIITDTDKQIIEKLKVNNLYLKIINFYSKLKIANQLLSDGKECCPVKINWTPYKSVPSFVCLNIRRLLVSIHPNTPFGKVLKLSIKYLQDFKFFNHYNTLGLVYNKKY